MKTEKSQNPKPPSWAVRFFRWYSNDHLSDAVLGDILHLYNRRCSDLGKRRADLLFIWDVIQFLQPFAIRNKNSTAINQLDMFSNYFTVAWRGMTRQKMFTAIKVGGFALGLATCLVIFLYIRHELSYDKNLADGSKVYRVYNQMMGPKLEKWTAFPASAANIMKTEYPEVEQSGRLIPYKWFNAGSNLFRRDNQVENSFEDRFAYADQDLLEILQIPLISGNQKQALAKPFTIVLSRKKAEKYFHNEDPVGKVIILNEEVNKPYTVGGVMEDFPSTSHLQFDFLITLTGVEFWPGEQGSWCCWNYNVYLKLRPDADPRQLEKKFDGIRDKYYVSYLTQQGDTGAEYVHKNHSIHMQPVSDIYLRSQDIMDEIAHGDVRYIWLFGGIAAFILLLACINFINLSTAKSANRAKEVGLRKVVGSVRGHLVRQFLIESLLYSLVSFVLALLMVWIALPYFNTLAAKAITIPWTAWWFYPLLLGAILATGLVAGVYPSFYLSSFKPVDVLKGAVSRGSKTSSLRSAMVVFQFTTSIVLITGTFIIGRQMDYILTTKVGFDKDQVVLINGSNTLETKYEAFRNELMTLSGVEHVTMSNYLPVRETNRDQNVFWREGKTKEEKGVSAQKWSVDPDYIATLGMKLVEGRNFNRDLASDSKAIIISQAMVKEFGFKNPIGERIVTWEPFTVIGVVADFHFETMKDKIGPLAFTQGKGGSVTAIKVNTKDMTSMIAQLTGVWKKFMPNQPIRYGFLDESYARMYDDVQRTGSIFASFATLAIIVACLGLFGLSAFMVEQRSKEISIRLVLGASVNSVFRLLTQNFLKLVLISFIIAVPVAWFMMKKWLEDYTYKISITWDVFVIAGSISVLIALLTVSYQSLSAALANPASRLRAE